MYARVARWEGADADTLTQSVSELRKNAEAGPPEGLPAKELLLLHDLENGKAVAVTLFETEDDYRQGDEKLNSMSPPGPGMGHRVSVEKFEVAVRLQA